MDLISVCGIVKDVLVYHANITVNHTTGPYRFPPNCTRWQSTGQLVRMTCMKRLIELHVNVKVNLEAESRFREHLLVGLRSQQGFSTALHSYHFCYPTFLSEPEWSAQIHSPVFMFDLCPWWHRQNKNPQSPKLTLCVQIPSLCFYCNKSTGKKTWKWFTGKQ